MRHKLLGSLRWTLWMAGLAMIFAFVTSSAHADSVCSSGNLAALMGTTCNVGSLQFSFTGFYTDSYGVPWTPTDFTFTTVANGFELSGAGPQTVTAPSSGEVLDYFYLGFTVTDLHGVITGLGVTGGNPSASGNALAFNYLTCGGGRYEGFVTGGGYPSGVTEESGWFGGNTSACSGLAIPFDLVAANGDTASFDSTDTQFTFITTSTPEPGTSTLVLCGLVLLLGLGTSGQSRLKRQSVISQLPVRRRN